MATVTLPTTAPSHLSSSYLGQPSAYQGVQLMRRGLVLIESGESRNNRPKEVVAKSNLELSRDGTQPIQSGENNEITSA